MKIKCQWCDQSLEFNDFYVHHELRHPEHTPSVEYARLLFKIQEKINDYSTDTEVGRIAIEELKSLLQER